MKIRLTKEASCSPFFLANSTGDVLEGDSPMLKDLVDAGFAEEITEPTAPVEDLPKEPTAPVDEKVSEPAKTTKKSAK